MSARRAWPLLAILLLPACLDSIVGSECVKGYTPCQGVCVVVGSCAVTDSAAQDGTAAALDAAARESGSEAVVHDGGTPVDVNQSEASLPDAGAPDFASPSLDVARRDASLPADVVTQDDTSTPDDTLPSDDVVTPDDAPALEDAPVGPILAVDAMIDAMIDSGSDSVIDEEIASDGGASLDGDDGGGAQSCVECVDGDDGTEAGSLATDADDGDATSPDDGPLICVNPLVMCNDQCVDESADPENCGICNNICPSGVCNIGTCLVCLTEESVCGRTCANLATDPDNCGSCGNPCVNGLCSNGQCQAAGTGRAIVIGHDYFKNRPVMNRILGNAVFLWPVNPVRLLVYEGGANATAIAGADAAIAQVATATGRQAVRTVAADVSTQLATADVFLIYGQETANDTTLNQLGLDWSSALLAFVNTGGTVVLLDGAYAGNSGTSQILVQAGVFDVSRNASATGNVCTVVARGDALATGLPRTYLCEQNSSDFIVNDPATTITAVVQDSTHTVVLHKIF